MGERGRERETKKEVSVLTNKTGSKRKKKKAINNGVLITMLASPRHDNVQTTWAQNVPLGAAFCESLTR